MILSSATSVRDRQLSVISPMSQEFIRSSNIQTGRPNRYRDELMDRKTQLLRVMPERRLIRESVTLNMAPTFRQHTSVEIENHNFRNNIQWTPAQIKKINESRLPAHQSNAMSRWIDVLLGEQRSAETIFLVLANTREDKAKEDFMNHLLAGTMRLNEFHYVGANVFEDDVVGGRGVSYVGPHKNDPYGRVSQLRCRPNEFMFDLETTINGNWDGTKYMSRNYLADVEGLMRRFPEFADELRIAAQSDTFGRMASLLDFTLINPLPPTRVSERARPAASYRNTVFRLSPKQVFVNEFYSRFDKPGYVVYDLVGNQDLWYPTIEQADYIYYNLVQGYEAMANRLGEEFVRELAVEEPFYQEKECVATELWANNQLLWFNESDSPDFPYQSLISTYRDGEWHGHFEHDKDHQLILNRMLVMIEMFTGSINGKWVINKTHLPDSLKNDDNELKEVMARSTDPIVIEGTGAGFQNDPNAMDKIIRWYGPGNYGTWPQELIKLVKEGSIFGNGGLSSIGQSDFAGQSGKSQQYLAQRAQAGQVIPFDELYRWLRRVGMATAVACSGLRTGKKLGFISVEDRARYLELAEQYTPQDLKNFKYDLEVVEKLGSYSERDRVNSEIKELAARIGPEAVELMLPEALEGIGMPQERLDRVNERMAAKQERANEEFEREQGRKDAETQFKIASGVERARNDRDLTEIKRHPPASVTLAANANFGPEAMAAVIVHSTGIAADGAGVARDMGIKAKFDLAMANQVQKNWDRNAPVSEKTVKGKGPSGKSKPKDSINRMTRRNTS